MSDLVLVDHPADHVTRITLNRADKLNAMNAELATAMHDALEPIRADRHCRAVIITGAGRGFCVGMDLTGFGIAPGNDGTDEARDRLGVQRHMASFVEKVRALPQPVIAAINGPIAGFGLGLALGCDIRYAVRDAVFRVAYINVGVSNCDMGTSWLLPRLIGASRAHELMLTGRRFDAEEAERIGLLADVTDDVDALNARALEGAEHIASLAPWGVQLTKQGMWTSLEVPSMSAAIQYEDRQQIMAILGIASEEAVSAFLEKRPAKFVD